jgi:hypothetical protein
MMLPLIVVLALRLRVVSVLALSRPSALVVLLLSSSEGNYVPFKTLLSYAKYYS